MRRAAAARMLDSAPSYIDKLRLAGVLTGHRLTEDGEYLYSVRELEELLAHGAGK